MSSKPNQRIKIKPRNSALNNIRVRAKEKQEGNFLGNLFKKKIPEGIPQDTGDLIFVQPHAASNLHTLHVRSSLPIYDPNGFHNSRERAKKIIADLERRGYTKYSIADIVAALIYETNENTK